MKTRAALLLVAASTLSSAARADDVDVCIAAAEKAQDLRGKGALRESRAELVTCASDKCPKSIRSDCKTWLGEVDAEMPSVVVNATDDEGHDLATVGVRVDGALLVDALDGRPIPVDPGAHAFVYEHVGSAPVKANVLIRVGEKLRVLRVSFGPKSAVAQGSTVTKVTTSAPQHEGEARRGVDAGTYAFAGLGAVAIGGFAVFGLGGKSDLDNLRHGCAPHCDASRVDDARSKLSLGDVSLGVAMSSLATASYFFFAHPTQAKKSSLFTPDVLVFSGVTVAGIVGFAALGLGGRSALSDARAACAPSCVPSDVGSARTRATLGDMSLGVAAVSLGAAAWLVVGRATSERSVSLRPVVMPLAGGAFGGLAGSL